MTSESLAQSYLRKAEARIAFLAHLLEREDYSDVVREAQEAVELALKAVLRQAGIEPPHVHDVSRLLRAHRASLAGPIQEHLEELARISARLRKERELSFSGDIDFIPTESYSREDASQALREAVFVVDKAREAVPRAPAGE
ncbi:HEPN domain-containing protein [Methylacidimicrobium sp. B4]|uniref:HEPN domain-containing protein n=1 Tax=Methylacidimicrobium sp. B4 TaxID=2796139 RepID=UPI001A8D7BE0|nr:HEPN domain-containing protein [Methylacidimicrobium sp. B4]QSR84368.1 HEPN domain-containing protein [Methylacidimicrobium sp. B4]